MMMKRMGILSILWMSLAAGNVSAQDESMRYALPEADRWGEPEFVFVRGKYSNYPADGMPEYSNPFYPTRYCNEAYKLTINYIIYALSH